MTHMLTLQLITCRKKFPEQRGVVFVKIIDKNHRRSSLMQGGLEISVQVSAEMDLTVPKGTRQYLKSTDRLSFQITKNPE